jgi:hypothetical protein
MPFPTVNATTLSTFLFLLSILLIPLLILYILNRRKPGSQIYDACEPPRPVHLPSDRFGLKFLSEPFQAQRQGRLLKWLHRLCTDHGPTVVKGNFIFTSDAENVKAVLGTKFEDW